MGFINKNAAIIRRSNEDLFYIRFREGLEVDYISGDKKNNLSSNIHPTLSEFPNFNFTLDKDDNINGIYNDKGLHLIKCEKGSNEFVETQVVNYDSKQFDILFPYVKVIDEKTHIFYYVLSSTSCALFHHYKVENEWFENKIDFINHSILDNYQIIFNDSVPTIFYFNIVNGYEEVFSSTFDFSTLTWSNPIQITNTSKNKIYLSVLNDLNESYHLAFCEYVDNGYRVKYIKGNFDNNYHTIDKFVINKSTYITKPSVCMYPNFINSESELNLLWVDYGRLYTSISSDMGENWSEPKLDEASLVENFIRSSFLSNCEKDIDYSSTSVFTIENSIGLLGF